MLTIAGQEEQRGAAAGAFPPDIQSKAAEGADTQIQRSSPGPSESFLPPRTRRVAGVIHKVNLVCVAQQQLWLSLSFERLAAKSATAARTAS